KKTSILLGFIVLKFLLQFSLISSDYDLQRDEFLHLDQGHHLAWGFQSVPPFTSWVSYIINLLGGTVFWIKFFPALFGALTIVVVWKAIEELGGNLFALVLGGTCILFSVLLRLNTLYQPNSFDVLSWTTFYFILIKYFKTENKKWLFIGAIVFALGFLNKYNVVFLVIGILPAVLLTEQRKVFTKKEFYTALVLALLLISPNLAWQYKNNFPVVHHLKELADTQLVNVDRAGFLKSQLLFFIGCLFVIVSALYALLAYVPFKKYKAFFWNLFFTLIVFIYFKAKDYYAIGLYPIYISFGSVFLVEICKEGWRKYLQPVFIAIPLMLFIPFYQIGFPNHSPEYILQHQQPYKKMGLLLWEDGKEHALPQDFSDMVGWKELAIKVDSVCSTLPDLDHTLVLCDNYGQAGAINYYIKNKKIVAESFHADYINWLRFDRKIKDVILVKEDDDEDKERKVEIPLFDSVYLAGKRINRFAREDTIAIYVLRGAKVDVNKRIKDEAERKKNHL
ncbi:glycosyltransferase family 39 protein, partial [Segetibacter aerophilus]|uniref:glycosyltransferase family 39 protein n=1 Tax=Segetibacter aerophilus TaxID=670293 RepID=UPI0011BDEAF8